MIFLTGDTHGEVDMMKLSHKRWPQGKELTKKDYVIVLGDFGVVFWPINSQTLAIHDDERYLIKWLNQAKFTTLFIRGNHDNTPRLNQYPDVPMFGSTVKQISDSIFYLLDAHIYTIEGKTFFTMGGAESIDKAQRRLGVTYWTEELPTYAEVMKGFEALTLVNNKVDYVLTHAMFMEAYNEMFGPTADKFNDPMNKILQQFKETLTYEKWFCGHYHVDRYFEKYRLQVLYKSIIQLGEGK